MTEEKLREGAKLSPKELYWINQMSKKIFMSDQRLFVIMNLCASIIGNLCIQTKIKKDVMVDLIKSGVEED